MISNIWGVGVVVKSVCTPNPQILAAKACFGEPISTIGVVR